MAATTRGWTDERFEGVLGNVLRWGVLSAAVVVLTGAAIFLLRHGSEAAAYEVFRGEPGDLRSVRGIVTGALNGRGRGLIQLGLLLLIATPVCRVALSVVVFALQRDRRYVLITLVVLAVLAYGLFGPRL